MNTYKKPGFVYVGRAPCGCVVALVNDDANLHTARAVSDFIKSGLAVNRESWDDYVSKISQELTFMNCQHKDKQLRIAI